MVPLDCPLEGFDGQIGTLAGAPDGEEPQGADIKAVEDTVGRNEELGAQAAFEIPKQWTWTQLSQLADTGHTFRNRWRIVENTQPEADL